MQLVDEAPFLAFLRNQDVAAGRSRRLTQDRQLRAVSWPLAGLVLGILLLVPAVRSAIFFAKLHYAPTRIVTAQVIQASVHTELDYPPSYWLTCRFVPRPGARPQTLTQAVPEYKYDSAPVGASVTVRHNIADPSIAELTISSDNIAWETVLVGVPVCLIFFCLRWLRPFVRRRVETWAIEQDGVVVPGRLIGSFDQVRLLEQARMHYEYCFSRDGKTELRGHCATDKSELAGRPIPQAGTPVLIYALDSTRHRML